MAATPADSTTTTPTEASHPAAVVVDVRTIHAHGGPGDESPSIDGSAASGMSIGGHLKAAVRDYCLSCVPPHIRRKGLAIPPFRVRACARHTRSVCVCM